MNDITKTEPRAWVGCLACYNAGELNGAWCDADDAEDWTCAKDSPDDRHEEFNCFDIEGLPGSLIREMAPCEFAELARSLEGVDHDAYDAYVSVVGDHYATVEGFEELYRGYYIAKEEYVSDFYDDAVNGLPMEIQWAIDWDHVADHLDGHYFVNDGRGVHVVTP